jgi:hypothetical protein
MKDKKMISVYKSVFETTPHANVDINDFLTKIGQEWPECNDIIQAIRALDPLSSEQDEKIYKSLKAKLPCCTISGTFKAGRKDKDIEDHSGYLALDIDRKECINQILLLEGGLEKVIELLKKEPWAYAIFKSVGGRSPCCIVKIPATVESHVAAFEALEKYFLETYELILDSSCKNVGHLRFVSSDPNLYINRDAEVYQIGSASAVPKIGINSKNNKKTTIPASSSKIKNQKNFDLVSKIVEHAVKMKIILGDDSYGDWMRIGFALVDEFGESGRNLFHNISAVSSKYNRESCDKKYTKLLNAEKRFGDDIGIGTFFYYAEKAGVHQGKVSKTHQTEELSKKIDFVSSNISPDNLQRLIKEIAGIDKEADRSLFISKLSKQSDVTKSSIKKDIGNYSPDIMVTHKDGNSKDIVCAKFPSLIDVVLKDTGETAYLIKDKNGDLNLASKFDNSDGGFYVPPKKKELPFALPLAEDVMEFYKNEDNTLFEDLRTYFKKFSYLPEEQWLVIIMSVFLSYLQDHDEIHYLPYISFFAVPERGKSKTGKAMTYVSYRGIHVVELREANLFRYSRDIGATLFFDIMNLWKKAVDNRVEDILLLRYERGARVSRVLYPEKGAFKDMEHYDVFGSTIFATNEAVDKILDTRCIPITMPNRPGRYEDPEPEKAQELKERLTAWRARVFDKPLPDIEVVPELNGRLWDITKPMLQVCRLVCPERVKYLEEVLINISAQKKEEKGAYIEGQIVAVLAELSPINDTDIPEWNIWTSDALSKLNEGRSEDRKLTAQYLGKKLKAIGINKRKVNGKSQLLLNRRDFNMLLEQYGIDSLNYNSTINSSSESSEELVGSLGNIDIFKL